MQIEIDFQVFQALTAMRESESDSYNHVIRRLLKLPPPTTIDDIARILSTSTETSHKKGRGLFGGGLADSPSKKPSGLLSALLGGVWFNGVHLPNGTLLRATYKGVTYHAEIRDGRWIGSDGVVRNSPSEAASAISGTNVNGWRFWFALPPGQDKWIRLDSLKQ